MVYLIILVIAASLAIGRLWLMQRRSRSHLQTVEGFQTGLRRLSEPNEVVAPPPKRPLERRKPPARHLVKRREPPGRRRIEHRKTPEPPRKDPGRSQSLDPERRAAAKQRIEARRAARQRAYG